MSKTFGYCRISTTKQSLERQRDIIRQLYPDAILIEDKTTGRSFDRPGWTKLLKAIKPDDTIVFDEVSRMSRDADEGFAVYEDLYKRGINLVFIAEPHMNTSEYRDALQKSVSVNVQSGDTATDNLVSAIMDALNKFMLAKVKSDIRKSFEKAQAEVDHNSRRTSKGLKTIQTHNEELRILYPDTYKDHPEYRQIGQVSGVKLTTKKSIAAKAIIKKHSKDFGGSLSDPEVITLAGISRNSYYKYKAELRQDETEV